MPWYVHAVVIGMFAFMIGTVFYMAATTPNPPRCLKYERTDYLTRGEPVYHCLQWSDK